ncbi:MAG TPA: DUF1579 domain-containing protein [Planctomycetota bacterium]|nr:DUF1579 domain-containing protein [Planctomycetota bacterium]
MKFSRLFATVSALALVTAAGVTAAGLRQGPVEPDRMHTWLQSHVGNWDAKIDGMMADSVGTWVVKEGPGGLWLVSEFKTDDMMGGPFHGMEFFGYDADSKTFTSYWIDSSSTRCSKLEGTYDAATKTMTLHGKVPGPTGEMVDVTHVTSYPDADHMKFEMKGAGPDGSEMTFMTIEYTRRK